MVLFSGIIKDMTERWSSLRNLHTSHPCGYKLTPAKVPPRDTLSREPMILMQVSDRGWSLKFRLCATLFLFPLRSFPQFRTSKFFNVIPESFLYIQDGWAEWNPLTRPWKLVKQAVVRFQKCVLWPCVYKWRKFPGFFWKDSTLPPIKSFSTIRTTHTR